MVRHRIVLIPGCFEHALLRGLVLAVVVAHVRRVLLDLVKNFDKFFAIRVVLVRVEEVLDEILVGHRVLGLRASLPV
jgi:hypothetical protein